MASEQAEDMTKPITSLTDLKPDPDNANRGTPRGHGIIEQSIRRHGAGRSGLAANDGTMIAGSQTLEEMAALGIPVKTVHTTGDEWVVVVRDDIESGSAQARLMAVEDNRASEVGLDWAPDVLDGIVADGIDLSTLFREGEMPVVVEEVVPGAGGDDFDTTPEDGPTRTQSGDLWVIGGVHRLLVGDCTDPANVERLMGDERALSVVTDPPYGVGFRENGWDKSIPDWLGSAYLMADVIVFTTAPTTLWEYPQPDWVGCWYREASNSRTVWGGFNHWSPVVMYGKVTFPVDSIKLHAIVHASDPGIDHPSPKPLALMEWLIEHTTGTGELMADPFLGSGTSIIAAHRTGRRCYGVEISPKYADVIIRRAESEGLTCERIEPMDEPNL